MASYATVVTLPAPVTGHVLQPSRSTTIQTTTDPATQAAITAAVATAMSGIYVTYDPATYSVFCSRKHRMRRSMWNQHRPVSSFPVLCRMPRLLTV